MQADIDLSYLDWPGARAHYDRRVEAHTLLLSLHTANDEKRFAELLVGVSDRAANYSAAEHGLGPKILASNRNAHKRLHALARRFIETKDASRDVPHLIRSADLAHLGIGVGSEASCMMNPQHCWVCNIRTLYSHLLIKHNDDYDKASEALELYRDNDSTSEMHYSIWAALHGELESSLTSLAQMSVRAARAEGVDPGTGFLWADAVASFVYAAE